MSKKTFYKIWFYKEEDRGIFFGINKMFLDENTETVDICSISVKTDCWNKIGDKDFFVSSNVESIIDILLSYRSGMKFKIVDLEKQIISLNEEIKQVDNMLVGLIKEK